jgi:hypothetical protein
VLPLLLLTRTAAICDCVNLDLHKILSFLRESPTLHLGSGDPIGAI